MSNFGQNMYYESSNSARSPGSQRQQQTVQRQNSRGFDGYGQLPSNLYNDDFAPRFDTSRFDRQAGFNGAYGFDSSTAPGAQTWNGGAFGQNSLALGRMKPPPRPRPQIPNLWHDSSPSLPQMSPFGSIGGHPIGPQMGQMPLRENHQEPDEELIPTAIVIKNIPFAVKKEQLVQLMTELNLPLPYAFNYHFDNGIFRGLAFANFTTPEETEAVINALNSFDLQGRKLRVEYKKMLPLAERERIEQEKRAKRGQLEEQHRVQPGLKLHNQASVNSLSSAVPPSPTVASRQKPGPIPGPFNALAALTGEFDLNDPQTLQFYSQLLLFRDDLSREALLFPAGLTPQQRRAVHTISHHMGLAHVSRGNGDQRQVHVFRPNPSSNAVSPSFPPIPNGMPMESRARGLRNSSNLDFNDARGSDPGVYSTIGRHASFLLDVPASPNLDMSRQNLRGAKSTADLRSYTPSPVPSSASFPATLNQNFARFADYGPVSGSSNTPTLTPTASGNMLRDDALLVGGLGGMSLSSPLSGPREQRSSLALDREQANVIGSVIGQGLGRNSFNMNFDDSRNMSMPLRQPRGPPSAGPGFIRRPTSNTNNRQSGELDLNGSSIELIGA